MKNTVKLAIEEDINSARGAIHAERGHMKKTVKTILKGFSITIVVLIVIGMIFGVSGEKTETPAETAPQETEKPKETPTPTEAPIQETVTPTEEPTQETASLSLPVKFGEVTSVGPLEKNSEMIIISLSENIKPERAVRSVYVSAVDYIFTYAYDELAELSVFGYDADGERIIVFTMPPELITALREIEADGEWGTEGFSAWFYFNDDAYNILVENSIVSDADDLETPDIEYGDLSEFTDNRSSIGVIIVKVKITPSYSNDATVKQNYYNVEDLIKEQGFDDCEIQYWAVADMTSGEEAKVVSFTVPADVVKSIAAGQIVANELGDYVTDLYIHDSLK